MPGFAEASAAADLLGEMLSGELPPAPDEPTPRFRQERAMWVLALLGLRTGRAALVLVQSGYWPEAQAFMRRMGECCAISRAVISDLSGETARLWLNDRYRASRAVSKYGSRDLHGYLDWSVHPTAGWLPFVQDDRFVAHHGPVPVGPFVPMILGHAAVSMLTLTSQVVALIRADRADDAIPRLAEIQRNLDALDL